MISLQRSMHSSQMYTPGPAMSFFTCFCDFPQKEHFSRSPPSPIRATYGLLPSWPDVVPGPVLTATPADHLHQPIATMPRRYLVPGVKPTPHEGVSLCPMEPLRLARPRSGEPMSVLASPCCASVRCYLVVPNRLCA